MSTDPADRREAERGAVELYQAFGLKAPEEFIWFNSFDEALSLLNLRNGEYLPFSEPVWRLSDLGHLNLKAFEMKSSTSKAT